MYSFFQILCKCLFKLTGGIEVTGQNRVPQKGPFVLVANHQSLIDPLVLMACIPRKIIFLAAAYVFEIPLIGSVVRAGGALPVNSPKGDSKSIKQSLSHLSKGGVIGVFPEGGVSLDGQLTPFLPGWAYLALKAGVPAIPVAISGTQHVLPVGKYIPRCGRIRINIGEPFPQRNKSKISRKDMEESNEKMAKTISLLMN